MLINAANVKMDWLKLHKLFEKLILMQKRNTFPMTDIFTNHVELLRLIFSNQTLETTDHWLKGYC